MSEWKKVKLGEILNFKRGYDLPKTERINGHFPVVGSNGIIGFHNDFNTAPCLTIGRSGNVGNPHYYNDKAWAHNTTLYVDDYKNNFPKFLFYFLKTLGLENYRGGSAVPTLNRNHIHILDICFPCAYSEQKAIADVLSALDDKIELNNKINKNLEEQAQALFKHWFVDFEFPNENGEPYKSSGGEMKESELGLIPKDWEVKSLDDIAHFLNGLAMQKYRPVNETFSYKVIKIRELNSGGFIKDSELCDIGIDNQYLVKDGDVVFSWSGTLLVKIWTGGIGGLNQHLFKVTSNNYEKWFYYFWLLYHLEEFKAIASYKATTMGHIKREHLTNAKVLVPKDLPVLDSKMQPVLEKISLNQIENQKLTAIRDYLLPKLMSGELRVN